ncbi:hypothetical protein [Pseudomonas putida]|uniref:Uncharacterized protein n=1 Tax=Pseudomonas putida TaxID=303 RepID=A0A177SAS5_PSEPU|nr:hypothetical protein [Pseudomonas putida]OAI84916.1 hypothetical protein AYO28_03265 [Pseudomonas putida]
MSKRKPHNFRARMERACRSLLSANHVAVVNIDPSGQQILVNWNSCKQIRSRQIVDAVCDIAHRWTIYLSVMCQKPNGEQYSKSVEVAPQGNYRAEHITEVIEASYFDLRSQCNPNHIRAAGWIAIPSDTSLDEAQAAKVFAAAGAWNQKAA